MSIYFVYREVSCSRRELIGRANTEFQACALALAHSRRQSQTFAVDACTPATLKTRLVASFRDGATLHATNSEWKDRP